MKIKTLIIDDEPVALAKLRNYIESIPYLEVVAECNGSSEALEYLSHNSVDVIFTDIEMPDIDGISFIESLTPRPFVVFITAHRDYAVDGFKLSAIDYLVKPYRLVELQRAANKVLEAYRTRQLSTESTAEKSASSQSIFIKADSHYERLSLNEIVYIKGYGEYLQIYTTRSPRPMLTLSSFQPLLEMLDETFIQIHRSYVVNVNKIERIEKNRVFIDSETSFPIGDSFREQFIAYIKRHSVGRK